MPIFEVESGGKVFEVDAPDQKSALAAFGGGKSGPVSLGDVGTQALADIKAVPGKLWEAARGIAQIPGRAGEAVQQYEQTGEYNPAPFMAAATIASPANAAMRAGDRLIPGVSAAMSKEMPKVPGAKELATVGGADISAAKSSPLTISSQAVSDYSRKIQQELFDDGIHPARAKDTYQILKELENAPSGSVFTPANLQTLRETLSSIAQNFNPNAAKDQLAASRAIKRVDAFLRSVAPKDTVAGAASGLPATKEQLVSRALEGKKEAERVAEQFARGRGNYAAAQRSNDITGELDRANTGILDRALARAQSAFSGRNIDNTIRSKVTAVLEKPKEVAGFSDAELAALQGASEGGRARNSARAVGNLLGGGGGLGSAVLGLTGAVPGAIYGGTMGAVAGATPAVVGAVSRSVANALAKRDIRKVDELIRKRSPLYEERLRDAPMSAITPEGRAALIRALMVEQQQ